MNRYVFPPEELDRALVTDAVGSRAALEDHHFDRLLQLAREFALWRLLGSGASWAMQVAWQQALYRHFKRKDIFAERLQDEDIQLPEVVVVNDDDVIELLRILRRHFPLIDLLSALGASLDLQNGFIGNHLFSIIVEDQDGVKKLIDDVTTVYRSAGGKGRGAYWDANNDRPAGPVIGLIDAILPKEICPSPHYLLEIIKKGARR